MQAQADVDDARWRTLNRQLLEAGHRARAAGDAPRARLAQYGFIQEELARLHVKGWRLRHARPAAPPDALRIESPACTSAPPSAPPAAAPWVPPDPDR